MTPRSLDIAEIANDSAPLSTVLVISGLGAGGAERVVTLIAEGWAGLGWPVTVLSLDGNETPSFFPVTPRVAVRRLGLLADSVGLLDAMSNTARRLRVLRAAIRRARPDVVVSFGDRTNVLALLACAGLDVPIVVSERTDPARHDIGAPWSWARRRLYPRAAAVVTQTETALAYFRRSPLRRTTVIPNPIDATAAPPAADRSNLVMGVGRLTVEKGFDLLIEAFARITDAHPDWTLVIHGEGPERRSLENLVARLGLQDRVFLPGVTAAPGEWIARAGVFVLPSRYEGFPNALGEALAAGLPAVAFDCRSGPRDMIRHGSDGLLAPAEDVGALADALDRLLCDPRLRARLGSEARRAMRRFAPEAMIARWTELARSVAENAK